ncbi:CHAT domain-containing protein [Mycena epipterygia]|nr:CHAT domain-containing protein [Mycena epipterygia]
MYLAAMDLKNLDPAIEHFPALLAEHPDRASILNVLGGAVKMRFDQEGNSNDLEKAIELHRQALAAHALLHPDRDISLCSLAIVLRTRFKQQGDLEDLDEAINLYREALALHPPSHPGLTTEQGSARTRLKQQEDSKGIDAAIKLARDELSHPSHVHCLDNLAISLHTKFEHQGNVEDLHEVIGLHKEALALQSPHDPALLNNLAIAITTKFNHQGDSRDLNEAIKLYREALALAPNRGAFLNNLANAVHTRFEQQGDPKDIDEAIELHREALTLRAPSHPAHSASLNNLAKAIQTRFEQRGDPKDIDEAIELYRGALSFHALVHPAKAKYLCNLADALRTRFEYQGDPRDINEAIELYREASALPHLVKGMFLGGLANALQTRFDQNGDSGDIDEAIELHREAVCLQSPHDPNHSGALNNLATAITKKFDQKGDSRDLNEAIELFREALALCAPAHPARSAALNNLANAIHTRFEWQGDPNDIDEATELHREALALRAPPHPDHSASLNNLAKALQRRFMQRGYSKDNEEAIELHRMALSLLTPPHPARRSSLNNLGHALYMKFQQHGDSKQIDEAIELHREALTLCTPQHPHRNASLSFLAIAVHTRFEQRGDPRDIEEAIDLYNEALALCVPPHPDRAASCTLLSVCLETKYKYSKHSGDLDQACTLSEEAISYLTSSPRTCFLHACYWAFTAHQHSHSSALPAYHATIELLPQLAALHLDLHSRQEILSTAQDQDTSLASKAAACAVGLAQFDTAVEFLEASRSVFWSQALQLRKPFEVLATIQPDLYVKITDLARQLEKASLRDTARDLLTNTQHQAISIESEGRHFRRLNEEWEEVIKICRLLPGLEDFMRPKGMDALKQAALSGPVIILTGIDSAYVALIVTLSEKVQCLRLPELTFPKIDLLADLSRGLSNPAFDFDTFVATTRENGNHPQDLLELEARLSGGQEGYINVNPDDIFRELLADLWRNIVKPVLNALNLEKSADPPRLWWCPTGRFSFLPLHAAGLYGPNKPDCASDYVVSSYTPTLTTLLEPPMDTTTQFQMTAIIQPQAPNCSPLPGAREELKKIAQRVPSQCLTGLGETTPATVESALVHLRESSIVHFACHGIQDLDNPLDSGLILTDGRLKISEIMRRPEGDNGMGVQKSMSLAFLSACETAKGDKAVPDEAMHLAATLLFAGFHGVVATMWTMNDLDGPKIADMFYEHLFKNCDPNSNPQVLPNSRQAAKALHFAVSKLRQEPDIPFRRWVPFVHYGL